MNDTKRKNLDAIRKGIKKFIPQVIEPAIVSVYAKTASAVFEWIDNHPLYYQDQTFNLRDSIGAAVYKNGVLKNWIQLPTAKATKAKKFAYPNSPYYTEIRGRDLLQRAISGGKWDEFADYALVVYAAAPYGIYVEDGNGKRGTGWWTEGLVPYVTDRFLLEVKKLNPRD